ncbi:GTPase HflX [Acidaminobacter sp.]|uniref:GTPase HflX n=1 Tax=Acidaminobacter sp. TaxID=1872102 RepID=UPI00256457A9|nr:GTPase HflX [Acidaminobacter sp.]MDK9711486.1 GTPase HflX [Acidaminobacter sp.]
MNQDQSNQFNLSSEKQAATTEKSTYFETSGSLTERAILVGLGDDREEIDIEYSMHELEELVMAAEAEVVGTIVQNKRIIEVATYIGSGKVQEVKQLAEANDANVIVFNDELSGSQIRNLEGEIGLKVIDRTALILDIFARRAQSRTSKLQIELAQLGYRLPRLTGYGNALSRTGGGIGTRGPGEQKLEIDKRRIRERISDIRNELKEETKVRETQKAGRQRGGEPLVALVGYTNAGKSSVMNRMLTLVQEGPSAGAPVLGKAGSLQKDGSGQVEDGIKRVFEKDMLFATLDTYHRRVEFEDNKAMVLVDTVGFVSKLPHKLVEAFKATLEEVHDADLLLHVVDVTNENVHNQISITEKVLRELDAYGKPTLLLLNKIDLLAPEDHDTVMVPKAGLFDGYEALRISARTGEGFDALIEKLRSKIFRGHVKVHMLIPYAEGAVYSYLCDNHHVSSTEYVESGSLIEVELDAKDYQRYKRFEVRPDGSPMVTQSSNSTVSTDE